MVVNNEKRIWDQLLYLYDTHLRTADDDYSFGYADAIGQVILDLGKIAGEKYPNYTHEAYKRIMEFTNIPKYLKDYPTPVEYPELST